MSLPTLQVAQVEAREAEQNWLIRRLWGDAAVGIIGGAPKSFKSWLGIDLAVSVASGTPCLGYFEVLRPGPVLVYLAEDALSSLRARVAGLCEYRRLSISELPLHVVTAPSLRLDQQEDCDRLDATLEALKPRLIVLDPLVRLHRLDENSAGEISRLLGYLRELNRRHDVAIVLVHHMSKKAKAHLGQALRGSGDLHAWTDSACYLVKRKRGLELNIEHRAQPAPEPMVLRLTGAPAHLEVEGQVTAPPPLAEQVRAILHQACEPRSRAALRRELGVNNQRLGDALLALESTGLATRTAKGWTAPQPSQGAQLQLPTA